MNDEKLFAWTWQLIGYLRGRRLSNDEIMILCGSIIKELKP